MKEQIPFRAWLMLLILALIWGSSFILIKKAVAGLIPLHVASLRVFTASMFFLPYGLYKIRTIPFKRFKYFLLAGSAGNLLPSFLFSFAMPHIDSSVSGILNALSPVFTLITGFLIWKINFSNFKIAGVIVGLIGCIILIVFKGESFNINYYALLIVFATFLYGFNINVLKSFFQDMNSIDVAAFALLSVGPIAGTVFFLTGGWEAIWATEAATISAGYTVTVALFSSAISLIIFMKLIQQTSAIFASSVTYLMPVISIFWGVMDNEKIDLIQIGGMVIILTGVFLTKK